MALPGRFWRCLIPGGFILSVFVVSLYSDAQSQCSFPFFLGQSCRILEPPGLLRDQISARSHETSETKCGRDWHENLRTKSVPLNFQWLAVHESVADITLLGPNGGTIPLMKMGTLPLLNNTAYNFTVRDSGLYKLMVSQKLVSEFALHPSDCYCPSGFEEFANRYGCPAEMGVRVREAMARWRSQSITLEMLAFTGDVDVHTSPSVIQYAIVDNKLYCKIQDGQHCLVPKDEPFWSKRIDPPIRLIQATLRKTEIPDLLFFFNREDNPLLPHHGMQPIFSPSSADWFADLLFPVYILINEKFKGGDVRLAIDAEPWEHRRNIGYFMGSLTGLPQLQASGSHPINVRLRAAEIARERPDLLNVTVTIRDIRHQDNPEYPKELLDRGILKLGLQPNQRGAAKYVIDLPGNSAAWRLGSRFGDGAVTFKSRSIWKEFWHYMLGPDRNVVMIDEWPEDLVEKVEAAKDHDSKMRCMARAAQLVAFRQLRQEDLICWVALNLQHLSTKYAFRPKLTMSEWHEIPRHDRDPTECDCMTG